MPQFSQKKYKKLGKWIRWLLSCKLFEVGGNATHTYEDLMQLPIAAALENSSIEHMSLIDDRASADAFYHHANGKLGKGAIQNMIHRYCAEIIKMLKNLWRTTCFSIAIDYTEDAFYGEKENPYVVGGKRKDGTNYGFKYLTVSIVDKGMRFIIFAYPVRKDENADAPLVEKGLKAAHMLGIGIRRALLDREFYNADIVAMLCMLGIEFIIPSKKDEKFMRMMESITEQKKRNRLPMVFPYVIADYPLRDQLVTQVVFREKSNYGNYELHAYITNRPLVKIKEDPYAVQEDYRERWAIENANKFQDAFNIHTNSANGLVRFLFFALTLLLHNFWVLVNLLAPSFSFSQISLSLFKEMLAAVLGFVSRRHYKHTQRERWAAFLGCASTSAKIQKNHTLRSWFATIRSFGLQFFVPF